MDMFEKGWHFYGDYFQHLISGWRERNHPNVKFLWYEDMRKGNDNEDDDDDDDEDDDDDNDDDDDDDDSNDNDNDDP